MWLDIDIPGNQDKYFVFKVKSEEGRVVLSEHRGTDYDKTIVENYLASEEGQKDILELVELNGGFTN